MVNQLVRVKKQTYASYLTIDIEDYEPIHGIIDEFGGRVKQFSQDFSYPDDWIIFFEMAKLQKEEFSAAIKEYQGSHLR